MTDVASRSWEDLDFSAARLARNRDALREAQTSTASRLENAGPHAGLGPGPDDLVHRLHRRTWYRIEETEAELTAQVPVAEISDSSTTLLVGLGTGERARRLLDAPGGGSLVAFENDPGLVTLALSRHDFADELRSGRFRLLYGVDLVADAWPSAGRLLRHPLLGPFLDAEWRLARRRAATPEPAARRFAVLAGELLQEELSDELLSRDAGVARIDATVLTVEQIAAELARMDAEAIFSINFEPDLARLAGRLGVKYVSWEIDPTASPLPELPAGDPAAEHTHVFTWRAARVALFRDAGYRHVEPLALAADPKRRRPPEDLTPNDDVLFVGSCMRRQGELHRRTLATVAARDAARRASWARFFGAMDQLERDVALQPCRRDVPDRIREALAREGLPDVVETPEGPADVLVLIGERIASSKRIATVSALAKEGLVVYGEEDWREAAPAADYRGPAGYERTLTRLYSEAAVNLDVGRIYQTDIVTLRVFEVAACGGFLLTEASPELAALFDPERELATYDSLPDLIEKVRYFRGRPDERRARAERFRARFLAEHTLAHRVDRLVADLPGPR